MDAPAPPRKTKNEAAIDHLFGAIKRFIEGEVTASLAVVERRLKAVEERPELGLIEARLRALETRPTPSYEGTWREGESYQAGTLITHSGSMWFATVATKDRPGTSKTWVLSVKKGSFG